MLRPHWQPGKLYTQQTETQTVSTLTPAPGQVVEQRLNMKQTTTIAVKTAGERKQAAVSFVAATGDMSFQDQLYKFDSANPAAAHPLLRQALAGAVGKNFTLVFDAEDQFVELQDMEKLAAESGAVTGLAAMADARSIGELFRRSLELGLPRSAVAPGERWTAEDELVFPQAGAMKVSLNSKYEENVDREGRPHAKIIFEGKISSAQKPGAEKPKGDPVAAVGDDSTIAGQLFFDLERRTMSLSVFLANLSLNLAGNRIPLRQQVTTRLVSITDNP